MVADTNRIGDPQAGKEHPWTRLFPTSSAPPPWCSYDRSAAGSCRWPAAVAASVRGEQPRSAEWYLCIPLPPEVQADGVHVGNFNAWSTVAHPMTRDANGLVTEMELLAGRRYRFRYLLDGDRWANDWAADGYVTNHFEGDDSVIDLTTMDRSTAHAT